MKTLDLLRDLAEQIPSLLTTVACIVFAVIRWRRYPTTASLLLVALVLLILHLIVFSVVYTWVPDMFVNAAPAADQEAVTRNVHLILGLVTNGSFAFIFALLLTAVFSQRPLVQRY